MYFYNGGTDALTTLDLTRTSTQNPADMIATGSEDSYIVMDGFDTCD